MITYFKSSIPKKTQAQERKLKIAYYDRHGTMCQMPNCREYASGGIHHIMKRGRYPNHKHLWHDDNLIGVCLRHHVILEKEPASNQILIDERGLKDLFTKKNI